MQVSLRILNAEPRAYSPDARAILESIGEVVDFPLTQDELGQHLRGFDVLIVRLALRVTREILEHADRLRVIVTATTGLDHIDLKAANDLGVAVLSLKGEYAFLRSVPATAEHTWALLLALMRKIPWAFDSTRRGEWDRELFRGRDLVGMRLGVLGLGRLGEKVAAYALAFGMQVGAHDPFRMGWLDQVTRFETLEALFEWSQILSVHLPLNEETRGLLSLARLRRLPRGAWLVNTARGALVDEQALVALLREGHLAGAAVDVLNDETVPATNPLLEYARTAQNLIVTPHIGGATWDSMHRTEVFMAEKLRRFVMAQVRSNP